MKGRDAIWPPNAALHRPGTRARHAGHRPSGV